jgi:hypothetical protein
VEKEVEDVKDEANELEPGFGAKIEQVIEYDITFGKRLRALLRKK